MKPHQSTRIAEGTAIASRAAVAAAMFALIQAAPAAAQSPGLASMPDSSRAESATSPETAAQAMPGMAPSVSPANAGNPLSVARTDDGMADMPEMETVTALPQNAPPPVMPGMAPVTALDKPAGPGSAPSAAMAPMQGGRPPRDARDPYAYSGGFQRSTMPGAETSDALRLGAVFVDQLEAVDSNQGSGAAWDVQAWYGGPFNRAWLRSQGDVRGGRIESASVEGLWFRSYHPFWGSQLGLRQDFGVGPDRTWAALGVQGAAPYWYGVEATAYIGDGGRTAARLKVSSDLRLTQRLVLRPELEADIYGRDDRARGLGSGLSTVQAGLRLRYEFKREFAPYVGAVWNRAFGETESLRRSAGGTNDELQWVVGIKVWR